MSSTPLSRRRFLAALGAGGTVGVAGCTDQPSDDAPQAASDETDWPTLAHDGSNTGYNPNATGPRDGAQVRWQVEASAYGPPVVADGRVLLAANDELLCFAADDGSERWKFTDGAFGSPPMVVGDTVFAPDVSGTLLALDAESGAERWRTNLARSAPTTPTPGLDNEELYLGDSGGNVYSIDTATGEIDWQNEVFGEIQAPPAFGGTGPSLHVATYGGEVYELSTHDGDGAWRQKLPGLITAAPAVVEETIYVGAGSRLFALDESRAGGIRWTSEGRVVSYNHLAVADGVVFGADSTGLVAADTDSGKTRWRADGDFYCSPAVAGDTLYVGDEHGSVHAYDVGGGTRLGPLQFDEKRWSLHLGEGQRVREGIVVADGLAFAVTLPPSNEYEPTLFALEPA